MNETEMGGTKLQRKPPPPQQQMQPPQMKQEQQMGQMQMQQPPSPQEQQMMMQMQQEQQMMMQQQQMQQQQRQPAMQQQPQPMQFSGKFKESFGSIDSKTAKYSILVILIFLILNSKIIWKQIMKIPMMGSTEPSIIALIVNSILAGIIFYIVTKMLIK